MIIGVPKEQKVGERRVAIVPDGVLELIAVGHKVLVESGAGELSGFSNEEYQSVGATLLPSGKDVWSGAELVVKVKEPQPNEIEFFRPGLGLFCFLHLAVVPELTKSLLKKGVIGLDYDLLALDSGRLPILEPMSVIAGKLAVQCGAYALQAGNGGKGLLMGGAVGVRPAKVLVIGAGAAGSNAARVALGIESQVTIMDINPEKLAPFAHTGMRLIHSSSRAIAREVADADLVIGSVLIPGALAPKLITKAMIASMQKGSALVDICIDQGGVSETSRPTTITEPMYIESGVVHYCVTNMPALVPRTSTEALTNASLVWVKQIAKLGLKNSIKESQPIFRSLATYEGRLTNAAIGQSLGLEFLTEAQTRNLLG